MDATDVGFVACADELKKNPIELTGRLFHDFFLQEKYMLPIVSIKIRVEEKAIPNAKDSVNLVVENLYAVNKLPAKILIAMVTTEAFNGKLSFSLYNFKHCKLSCITLTVNNDKSWRQQINYDFDNNIYLVGYQQYVDALNMMESSTDYTSWIRDEFLQIFDVAQSVNKFVYTHRINEFFPHNM